MEYQYNTIRKCLWSRVKYLLYSTAISHHICISNNCSTLHINLALNSISRLFGCFSVNSLAHLIHELQVWEKWDVFGPFHCTEEQPGCQLADILNAHQVVSLHALRPVA